MKELTKEQYEKLAVNAANEMLKVLPRGTIVLLYAGNNRDNGLASNVDRVEVPNFLRKLADKLEGQT